MTYELSGAGAQTTLTLTQSNSPAQQDADRMVKQGWTPILQELQRLLESGQ